MTTAARTRTTAERVGALTEIIREMTSATTPQEAAFTFGVASRRYFPADGFLSVSKRGLPQGKYKLTRIYLDGRLPESPAESNPWRDWARLPTHEGGFIGELLGAGEARPVARAEQLLLARAQDVEGRAVDAHAAVLGVPYDDAGGQAGQHGLELRDLRGELCVRAAQVRLDALRAFAEGRVGVAQLAEDLGERVDRALELLRRRVVERALAHSSPPRFASAAARSSRRRCFTSRNPRSSSARSRYLPADSSLASAS